MTVGVTSWQRVALPLMRESAENPASDVAPREERPLLLAPRMLRTTSLLLALALLGVTTEASAQVFTNISRSGSPRTQDPGGIQSSLNITSPIGLRDCESEEWTFTINFAANPGGMTTTSLQYFIGADAMACTMANARAPVTSGTARCWPIRQTPSLTFTNPTTPLSYTVRIQSRYTGRPRGRQLCDPRHHAGDGQHQLPLAAGVPSVRQQRRRHLLHRLRRHAARCADGRRRRAR